MLITVNARKVVDYCVVEKISSLCGAQHLGRILELFETSLNSLLVASTYRRDSVEKTFYEHFNDTRK